MENLIKEKYLEDSPSSLSLNDMEKIIYQMKKGVCKIYKGNGAKGTGFFCKIPFPNQNYLLPVLFTNNHILGENEIKINSKIQISLNDDSELKIIKINELRKVFTNQKLDITIIEIKPNEDRISFFFDIDDIINNENENLTNIFRKKSIYMLHYPKSQNVHVSYGLSYSLKNNVINHICISEKGSSGAPILSLNTFKIIGIHCGEASHFNYNLGSFIKEPILKFYNFYKDKEQPLFNELTIIYKLKNNFSSPYITLFGEDFVNNNKDNCKIIVNNEIRDICYKINKNEISQNTLIIKLREIKPIVNFSKMFQRCEYLYSIPDITNFNTNNISDMSNMFSGCIGLLDFPIISNWDTSNVKIMNGMFAKCKSLLSLPDISKWNISSVENMENMFVECVSLKYISDISGWNTSNVVSMRNLFNKCESLKQLPDISKWNTSKVTDMNSMFYSCSSLISLPDISNWNTNNVNDMGNLFNKCSSLKYMPDISKWDISKVTNLVNIFAECSSLGYLPEISKWNTYNVNNMSGIFEGCKSLHSLPDISNWNLHNVTDIKKMFKDCSSLIFLPDISKWNITNVKNMKYLFSGCQSLKDLPNLSKWKISNKCIKSNVFDKCSSLKISDIQYGKIFN